MQFSGLAVQQVDRTEVKQMLEIEWQCIRLLTFQLIGEQICITIMVNPSNIKTINVFVCLFKFGLLKFFLSPKHADEKRAQGTVMFHTAPILSGLTLFCQCFVTDTSTLRGIYWPSGYLSFIGNIQCSMFMIGLSLTPLI